MKENIVKTFCDFVQIDSPTGFELDFSHFLVNELKKLGATPTQDERGNIFCSFDGFGEPILFAAHIDTVEPGRGIKPVVEGGFVKSATETILGADNKAAVAVIFEIMRWASLQESHRAFEVLFSVSEESGVPGVDTFDFSLVRSKTGLCFDVSKPFGTIVLGSPFYMSQKLTILGKEADASTAERGVSIIPALGYLFTHAPQGRLGDSFVNIGKINGGQAANALLAEVELNGEIRSFNESELDQYARQYREIVTHLEEMFDCSCVLVQQKENFGYQFSQEDAHVFDIASRIKKMGSSIEYIKQYWGVSDANNINKNDIKIFNVGYGVSDPHTVREKVEISELERVFDLISNILSEKN